MNEPGEDVDSVARRSQSAIAIKDVEIAEANERISSQEKMVRDRCREWNLRILSVVDRRITTENASGEGSAQQVHVGCRRWFYFPFSWFFLLFMWFFFFMYFFPNFYTFYWLFLDWKKHSSERLASYMTRKDNEIKTLRTSVIMVRHFPAKIFLTRCRRLEKTTNRWTCWRQAFKN